MRLKIVSLCFLLSALLYADEQEQEKEPDLRLAQVNDGEAAVEPSERESVALVKTEPDLKFLGFPVANYTSDDGVGMGAMGYMLKTEEGLKPYRYAMYLQLFGTTKALNNHIFWAEYVDVAGLPLRLRGTLGIFSTRTHAYCGFGQDAVCVDSLTKPQQSEAHDLDDHLITDLGSYNKVRYFKFYGIMTARWTLKQLPHKVDLFLNWRGSYYLPGEFKALGPYPNSLFTQTFGESGQKGFAGVWELGFLVDNRDHEPYPQKGYWLEASLRGSSVSTGSNWNFAGANMVLRTYTPFDAGERLLFATQTMFDGLIGDPPLYELIVLGGLQNYFAFGGNEIGRGIRVTRFPGKVRFSSQIELRYMFWGFDLWSHHFDLIAVGFGDLGISRKAWQDLKTPSQIIVGFGGGLRFLWNKNFSIRLEAATSPYENYAPYIYFKIGNLF